VIGAAMVAWGRWLATLRPQADDREYVDRYADVGTAPASGRLFASDPLPNVR